MGFSSDGRFLASGSADGVIMVYHMRNLELFEAPAHEQSMQLSSTDTANVLANFIMVQQMVSYKMSFAPNWITEQSEHC